MHEVSVVIATLGGPTLQSTIDSLNSGFVIPDEIIIAIPAGFEESVADLKGANVIILITKTKGQVPQRCEGFSASRFEYVLQCDDDIIVANNCLEELIMVSEKMGEKSACASSLYFMQSNCSVYQRIKNNWFQKFYYSLLNGKEGYKEGIVTMAGTEIGVDTDTYIGEKGIIPVEWLPGGIVLHRNSNLILSNFYPHKGKAFSEDLYHSYELAKKGISLFIAGNAKTWIEDPRNNGLPSLSVFYQDLKKDFQARKFYVQMTSRCLIRTYLFYLFISLSYLMKKVKQ